MTQLVIIAIYLGLLVCLGMFASRVFRGTSKDYMLASHTIGPFLLLMSLFGTTMTAFALVGSTGEAYSEGIGVYGMLASSSGIIHSLCFFLIGVKLWGYGRRYGYVTQVQFFKDRLESPRIGVVLFPILVGLVIPYLLIGVSSAGTVINSVTEGAFSTWFAEYDYGLPPWIASLVICGVVLVYVFFGGMRGTAWANAFQTMVFMALGVVTFYVISDRLGGARAASQAVLDKHPSKLMRDVDSRERNKVQGAKLLWEALAEYNYAAQHGGLRLSPDATAEAHRTYAGPKPPGQPWQRRAEAIFAQRQGLVRLTGVQRQLARIVQDDRFVLSSDLFDSRGVLKPNAQAADVEQVAGRVLESDGKPLPLKNFPRVDDDVWKERAHQQFAARIGNPRERVNPSDPESERKWTRRRAEGAYRISRWAPEEPQPMSKTLFLTYLLVPLSVGMFPHLFQHWLTAKSANSFKLAVVAHPIFIMIVWAPCVLLGAWATSVMWEGRELIPAHFPPNAVLSKMVKDLTGDVLGGLLTAGVLAAIMSSLDSQFLCIGTMFTHDVVVPLAGKKRFTDRQQLLLARGFIIGIVAVTYALNLFDQRRVFQLGVWCFSGFSSLFPIVIAALYWRRVTAAGVYAGIAAATSSWLYLFWKSDFGMKPNYAVKVPFGGEWHETMPVLTIVLCTVAAMVLVSLVTRPPSEKTLAKFFRR
jgi:solute:Na+ symporter, SSS family